MNYPWVKAGLGQGVVGEYAFSTNFEACGDDDNERLTSQACDGSVDFGDQLCCPASSSVTYKADNGRCVPDNQCPDIQRAPPVWVPLTQDEVDLMRSGVVANGGECCPCSQGTCPVDSLCNLVSNSEGCFLASQSISTSTPPPLKEWCDNDAQCVIGLDSESNLTLCEDSSSCNDKEFEVTPAGTEVVCGGSTVSISSSQSECYVGLKDTCSVSTDVHNCISTSRTVCDPASYDLVVCNVDGSNCRLAYKNNSCHTVTSYHGPFCDINSSCQEEFCMYKDSFSLNKSALLAGSCENISDTVLNNSFFVKSSNCEDESYCSLSGLSSDSVACMNDKNVFGKNVFIHSNNKTLTCKDSPSQTFGDYWCPKGFKYISDQGICKKDTKVCDRGFAGHLEYGCDTPLDPHDDHWKLYQKNCVFSSKYAPEGLYDSFCCLDAVLNNYQIWQEHNDANHVKVY